MPIYEYVCSKCNKKFEKMRPVSKSGDACDCPACNGKSERVLSRFLAFSNYAPGLSNPLGNGGGCSTCGSSNCSTCGSANN